MEKTTERKRIEKKRIISRNIGYKLPRGSKVALEIHYESSGRKVIDDFTQVHISFHKEKPKYKKVTYAITNNKIKIPPHTSNYKLKTSYKIKKNNDASRSKPSHAFKRESQFYICY